MIRIENLRAKDKCANANLMEYFIAMTITKEENS
jgi:hypothetical protein